MNNDNRKSTFQGNASGQREVRTASDGNIVRPILPSRECRYCKKIGHTVKDCEKLKEANGRRARQGRGTSRYANPVHAQQQPVMQAFCSVCRHAGRPESEYTSHFVKDQPGPNGKVVCPLLLSQKCRYCKVLGHTPTQCPKILRRNEKEARLRHLPSTSGDKDFPLVKNNERSLEWLDIGITPEEEEEARIAKNFIKNNIARDHNRLKQMQGTGHGPLDSNYNGRAMYHDWCAARWGDWERTEMGATFFDHATRRKYGWEEWCTKDHNYQKARKLEQHKRNSLK